MPVITDPVRQKEEGVRMFYREVLGGGPIAGDVAACQPWQKVGGSGRESVGEAKMVAQPAYYAVGASQFVGFAQSFIRTRMHQERSAAVQVRPHDVDTAVGLIPVIDDHVF